MMGLIGMSVSIYSLTYHSVDMIIKLKRGTGIVYFRPFAFSTTMIFLCGYLLHSL